MVIVRSRGPSHCTSSPGSVWARKTRSRGASNSRVMMICGMPGSAVIRVLLIAVPFHCVVFCCRTVWSGRGFLAVVIAGRGLQRGQQVIEPLVAFIPEPLVAGQPRGHLAQRLGFQ